MQTIRLSLVTVMVLVILCTSLSTRVDAYGVGWCHTFGGVSDPHVDYIYPGSSLTWAKIEPVRGRYDFTALDSMIQQARSVGKRIHVQFLVSNPNIDNDRMAVVPPWAVESGMHVVTTSSGSVSMPIQWDPLYVQYHGDLLRAFAAHYDKQEYSDVIEAVVMQSGGNWGEMALPVKNAANLPNADVLDPTNYFVQEIARVYLGSESRSGEIARKVGNNFVFDDYYIRAVRELIDLYARSITHYPFALQLGNGLSWQQRVAQEPVEYGIGRYGSRMWIRSAAWGSFGMGSDEPHAQDFWGRYQDRTVLAYEPGHPSWWCAADSGYTKGGCYDCCQWQTQSEADQHNANFINMAVNSGAVATCFQSVFFTNPAKYRIDFDALHARLFANVQESSHLLRSLPPPLNQSNTPPPPLLSRSQISPTRQPSSSIPSPTLVSLPPYLEGTSPTAPLPNNQSSPAPPTPIISDEDSSGVQYTPIQVNKILSAPLRATLCGPESRIFSALKTTRQIPLSILDLLQRYDASFESSITTWIHDKFRRS